MNFSRFAIAAALSLICNTSQSCAQTPPGFSPATNKSLGATFAGTNAALGGSVPLSETKIPPLITAVEPLNTSSSHIVMMVDLDTPGGASNRSLAPYLHWLFTVPKGVTQLSNETNSTSIAQYVAPGPHVGDGPHRYVILLFVNPSSSFTMPASFRNRNLTDLYGRVIFDVNKFATEGHFDVVAATWFETERKTVVPITSAANLDGVDSMALFPYMTSLFIVGLVSWMIM
ncbi:uncharacterized protein TrAtP1_009672 [Trichoderma atroviride]|uniref:uncharacterized protein n=1 Tax=Hypocrea atroviridis TaxID=63577 RepID=UPI00332B6026|nr:hypothetical protein TrAtP1_009672 [Trichoderma atroviride]